MRERLSRRERQILDNVYRRGRATAEEVREDLGGEVSNSAVRTMLGILETKGLLAHEAEGKRFVYLPTVPAEKAGVDALKEVVTTFFSESPAGAVAAFIEASDGKLSEAEYDRLARLIEDARAKEG
jgi:BlaI family penicillinase repressor